MANPFRLRLPPQAAFVARRKGLLREGRTNYRFWTGFTLGVFRNPEPSSRWSASLQLDRICAHCAVVGKDYGVVTRFRDSETERRQLVIAAIRAWAMLAAGEFLTNPKFLKK
jgi:hypothetical protein